MKVLLFLVVILSGNFVWADDVFYEGPADWSTFDKFMAQKEEDDRVYGVSYMLAGAFATVGGVVGYYSSDDSMSRGLYAISQSVGVAAIGYGASHYFIGNDYTSFYRAVDGSSLSGRQKTELLRRFLDLEKVQAQRQRNVKALTHTVIAFVNFYSANREEDRDIKGILNFLGVLNAAVALNYVF